MPLLAFCFRSALSPRSIIFNAFEHVEVVAEIVIFEAAIVTDALPRSGFETVCEIVRDLILTPCAFAYVLS